VLARRCEFRGCRGLSLTKITSVPREGYVLRPAVAQERVEQRPDGLVRITLKKAYADGTIAVDMDPLSLLCRLARSMPPPRLHTIRYAGVLAPVRALGGRASRRKRSCASPKSHASLERTAFRGNRLRSGAKTLHFAVGSVAVGRKVGPATARGSAPLSVFCP
jgi:Putative transposase